MDWIGLALALFKLVNLVLSRIEKSEQREDGRLQALAEIMEKTSAEIRKGQTARLDQRARDAGGVPDDGDPFVRD